MQKILLLILVLYSNTILSQRVSQGVFPVLEDDITFCYYCDNDQVVDKVWKSDHELYTKIKSDNSEYELFQLDDSTYHVRKYRNKFLIEEGKYLLRKENILYSDTTVCWDCLPVYELIIINHFAKPEKIGRWKIINPNGAMEQGKYKNNLRVGWWTYKLVDTTLMKNISTKQYYYVEPNNRIINTNKDWLYKKFYLDYSSGKFDTIDDILNGINSQFTIKFYSDSVLINANIKKLEIQFTRDNNLEIVLKSAGEIVFSTKLEWEISDENHLTLFNENGKITEFKIWTLGPEILALRNIN